MELFEILDPTITNLGYELVNVERSSRGRLLRIFIDKPGGVNVEDCGSVSNHLSKLLTVENIFYDRLEVSSPGLDRLLTKKSDFIRFTGQEVKLKLRLSLKGRRNFIGVLHEVQDEILKLDIDGEIFNFKLNNLEKVRLVPKL
ncbi:MAG: ribosome maturation factor RimP [Nitrosomonadaceae bacterium]|nr:ribosome maturation factor RimP [Nitrosomonadaceae bacterium]|tara:strand:- start:896 stop:1324 length:429 start_codon:yes stop_codon:yes gene_type:complete